MSIPSIAPHDTERDVYLVLEDFGRLGRSWREADEDGTDRERLIRDLVEGSTASRCVSWPSTRPRAGPATSLLRSPTSYAAVMLSLAKVSASVLDFLEAHAR